ncbi:MAG: hypothetical protein M1825_002806 [Sarcosagium campestre]|nr:MAG: hypothetical protein M1825_002806 [Sarcosagium campestre]
MTATGHVIGYVAGTVDLVSTLGKFMGDTQFKQLCVISATSLLFTQGTGSNSGAIKTLAQILKTTLHLPKRIQAICWTQFWAWIGWFPFLFYSSTWVGETYFRYSAPADAKKSADALGDIGRVGSLSLVVFSVLAFVGSTALPWLVRSPEDEKPGFRPPVHLPSAIRNAYQFKPDLLTTWMVANLMFAVAMSMAPFVRSVGFATVLVALCGLPWAVACWAPFSLIGVEINRLGAGPASARAYHRISTDSVPDALHLDDYDESAPAPSSSTGELAGIYLGILNVFTTLPQFVGTFIAGIVFSILEPGTSPELAGDENAESHANVEGVNAISVCLFIGALSALVAAYSTTRLRAALQQ